MSEHSEREWKSYLLSKGVFGNALRFAHLEKPEEVDRTSGEITARMRIPLVFVGEFTFPSVQSVAIATPID